MNAATGARVQLRGVNVCSLEFDRQGLTWKFDSAQVSQLLERLADPLHWHANVVRMPLNQQWFLEDDGYVARVEQVIDQAAELGLYVVVDVQWEVGEKLDPYSRNILEVPTFGAGNTTEAFWHRASSRWANRTNVLFDLINEPHGRPDSETALAMQTLVNGLRTRDSQVLLVVGGMNWAPSVDFYRTHPLVGANLVYAAHQYLPFDPPSAFAANFATAASERPVLVGEFLADEAHADFAHTLVDAAEAAGTAGWLPWAVGCGFDEFDDEHLEPLRFLASEMRRLNP